MHSIFSPALIWVLIPICAIVLRHRRKMAEMAWRSGQPQAPAQPDPRDRELAELRERVRVLERIATDSHRTHDLAEEIEKLR